MYIHMYIIYIIYIYPDFNIYTKYIHFTYQYIYDVVYVARIQEELRRVLKKMLLVLRRVLKKTLVGMKNRKVARQMSQDDSVYCYMYLHAIVVLARMHTVLFLCTHIYIIYIYYMYICTCLRI